MLGISGSAMALAAACLSAGVFERVDPAGYGDVHFELPSWRERALQVLTNGCRMDPEGYRDLFLVPISPAAANILTPELYPPVPPLYWTVNLNASARYHAEEMAEGCTTTHDDCNGTTFATRLRKYYTELGQVGENQVFIFQPNDVLYAMNYLLLEAPPGFADPLPDGQNDGHRKNIMTAGFTEMGSGFAEAAGKRYFVQDLGSGRVGYQNPIVAGSHFFLETGRIHFLVNYYDPTDRNPLSIAVVVEGQAYGMSLFLGAESQGTCQTVLDRAEGCRKYYYSARAADGTAWRYPENGFLLTTGEGGCAGEYQAPVVGRQKAGDCSQDSSVDISDAICLLGYLFTGRPTLLPCGTGSSADAANLELLDLNGDQRLDLSDPVHLLGFLFLGTPPPVQGLDCRETPGCPARCL